MTKCRSCLSSDTYEEGTVTQTLNFNGQLVIFENVPALVCGQCGDVLFEAATIKRMESLGRGEAPPSRRDQVPVYDFAQVA